MAKLPKLPNGLTYKQEQFAREVAAGSSLIDAYKLSYDAANMQNRTISSNAFKLAQQAQIAERIEEIQEQKLYHERLSEEFVLGELVKNHYRALENDELGHSNRTLELLGRNLNLWKEQPSTNEQVAGLFAWLATDNEVEEPQGSVTVLPPPSTVEKEEENQVKEEEKEGN
jgi:hypothetical protein